jgi:hypothetical protein
MTGRHFIFATGSLVIALLSAGTGFAQSQGDAGKRGFMFQIGAGPAEISYGNELDAGLAAVESLGLQRVTVYVDLSLGYAVGKDLYLVAGVDGGGDRLFSGDEYVQINSYLYSVGLRYYPFHTGLVLGVDGGGSAAVIQSNIGVSAVSDFGWGGGGTIAYDFDRKATGFGLEPGLKVDYLEIEGSPVTVAGLYLNLLWK